MLVSESLISIIPLKSELIRKNNLNIKYLLIKNFSFLLIPLIVVKSLFLINLRFLLLKNKLSSLFLKLSYFNINSFCFSNNNLIIYFNNINFVSLKSIKLLLLNFCLDLELINCFFYFTNYYVNYAFTTVLDNVDFLNKIENSFQLDFIINNIIFEFISALWASYLRLNKIFNFKYGN